MVRRSPGTAHRRTLRAGFGPAVRLSEKVPCRFMPTQRLLRATPSADGCAAATSVRFLNCSGTPRLPCSLQLILVDREPWLSIPSFRLLNGLLSKPAA